MWHPPCLALGAAVLLAGCASGTTTPSAASVAPPSASASPTPADSPAATAGVSVRYVEGVDGRLDVRQYQVPGGQDWTETSPFGLDSGVYDVNGTCAGRDGEPLGATVVLQRVRPSDGAVEREYRWTCGPVETEYVFGELRRLEAGRYRLALEDNTSGVTVSLGPAPADAYLDEGATMRPSSPTGARAVARVVPCPPAIASAVDPSPGQPCVVFDLSWTPVDGASTYRVYEAWRMPGTPLPPCDPAAAALSIATSGGTRATTAAYTPAEAQGTCFWLAAANGAGESKRTDVTITFP